MILQCAVAVWAAWYELNSYSAANVLVEAESFEQSMLHWIVRDILQERCAKSMIKTWSVQMENQALTGFIFFSATITKKVAQSIWKLSRHEGPLDITLPRDVKSWNQIWNHCWSLEFLHAWIRSFHWMLKLAHVFGCQHSPVMACHEQSKRRKKKKSSHICQFLKLTVKLLLTVGINMITTNYLILTTSSLQTCIWRVSKVVENFHFTL